MLETPSIPWYCSSVTGCSDNSRVRTISREVAKASSQTSSLTPQRLHAELLETSVSGARAYLHGAAHDAYRSRRHRTVRFGQSDVRWLEALSVLVEKLERRAWIYREGRSRDFWILETSVDVLAEAQLSTAEERLAYARGYFDAEGGIPRNRRSRFYVQFVQKNRADLAQLRSILEVQGIRCGKLHNPSRRGDRDLWRFYVAAASHAQFSARVGSWHPRKRSLLVARFGDERRG